MIKRFGHPEDVKCGWKWWVFIIQHNRGSWGLWMACPMGRLFFKLYIDSYPGSLADDYEERVSGLYWFKISLKSLLRIVDISIRIPVFYWPKHRMTRLEFNRETR